MWYFIKNIIYINIICLLIKFSVGVTTTDVEDDKIIRILIEKPHPLENQYKDDVLEAINNHFMQQNVNNKLLKNVRLEFSYCDKERENKSKEIPKEEAENKYYNDREYVNYLKCVIGNAQDSKYDLLLLNDKFIFSDLSFVENVKIEELFGFRKLHNNYYDITKNTQNHDLSFHERKIAIDGKYTKDIIYGLPYDFNFDVLYYHDDASRINNLSINSWDDLLSMDYPSNITLVGDQISLPNPTIPSTVGAAASPNTTITSKVGSAPSSNPTIPSKAGPAISPDTTIPPKAEPIPSGEEPVAPPHNTMASGEEPVAPPHNTMASGEEPVTPSDTRIASREAPVAPPPPNHKTTSKEEPAASPNTTIPSKDGSSSVPTSTTSAGSEPSTSSSTKSRRDQLSEYDAPLSIPLKDQEQLLNMLVEYVSEKKNLTLKVKTFMRYHQYFYDEQSHELYKGFRNFVENCSGLSIPDILNVGYTSGSQSFIRKEKKYFKGKMSHYPFLKNFSNITISVALPPKRFSVVEEHYLVINKHSKKDKEMLFEAMLQLTSKEMQLFRADYGYIPTFDMALQDTDEAIHAYCQNHTELCQMIQDIESIRMQKIFKKDKFSVTFMEIRLLLPTAIKNFLINNNVNSIITSFRNSMEAKIFHFKHPDIYTIGFYILSFVFALLLTFIIVLVYKNRNHPYMKVISPIFCILVMVGLIANSFTPMLITHITSPLICRILYVQSIVSRTLIFVPLFMVVLRIFCIYNNTSKVTYGKKFNDKRLLLIIGIDLLFMFTFSMIIANVKEFYIITLGDINNVRYLKCYHDGTKLHMLTGIIYYGFFFAFMILMVARSGKFSKKFDEIRIIFLIILLLGGIVSMEVVMIYSSSTNYSKNFFFIFSVNFIISCICIYLLVGSRLLFIMKHPQRPDELDENNSFYHEYFSSLHISDFIDKKYFQSHPMITFKPKKEKLKSKRGRSTNNGNRTVVIENDPIANNPNNYFFNKGLELLNSGHVYSPHEFLDRPAPTH